MRTLHKASIGEEIQSAFLDLEGAKKEAGEQVSAVNSKGVPITWEGCTPQDETKPEQALQELGGA